MLDKLSYILTKERLSRPPSLILFVTNRCNARCLHCFNWQEIDKESREEIKLEEIRDISAFLGPLMEVSISGGEPFLRPDLPEILGLFKENELRSFSIPTNGLLPDTIFEETRRLLSKRGGTALNINLSLDGLEKEHDYLRQREGAFKQVMKTYEKLSGLKAGQNFGFKVLTTLYDKNIDCLEELMAWVKDHMPAVDFHSFEILRGSPRESNILPPTLAQLEKAKEKIFAYWRGFNFYGDSFNSKLAYWLKRYLFELYIRILKEKRQLIPCFAGTFTLVIDASGNVYFCELLPRLGNIRERPLQEILSSSQAQTQREKIKAGECWCVHSCFQGKNLYLNYKLYGRFLGYLIKKNFLSGKI